jgi:hypothetical protein
MQKVELVHETENSSLPLSIVLALQLVPLYTTASPDVSTATQKELLAHEMALRTFESIFVEDQVEPL